MSRRCSVCLHSEKAAIEKALIAVEPFRDIAARFSISMSAVVRHREKHLLPLLAKLRQGAGDPETAEVAREQKAREADEVSQALDVLKQLKAINAACLEVLTKARSSGNDATLLRAVDRIHRQIELQSRLLSKLPDAPPIDLVLTPEWQRIRHLFLAALEPFPEARLAVAEALKNAGA
jgi:hypothetical protein